MYNLEYLPVALQDMVAIVRYISRELGNPAAADRLATELIDAGDSIPKFPYMNSSYTPIRPLKHEYGDMVVLSMDAFENLQFESEVYFKLQEAEREAKLTDKRYSSKEVLKAMRDAIGGEQVV